MIEKELLATALSDLRQLISAAKVTFLNNKIADNTGKKSLFKIVDSFLLKKPSLRLPAHNSLEELVETFNHFFIKKIGDIRGLEEILMPLVRTGFLRSGGILESSLFSLLSLCLNCRL